MIGPLLLRSLMVFGLVTGAGVAAAADGLTYLVHQPAPAAGHPPLIVLLHGAGADERDMIGLWTRLPPQFVVVSPRAPFGDAHGYRWYRQARGEADRATSRKIIDLVVDNAVRRFDVDPARVFVGGFSQGAVMVYEVALREPGRFRGAAVLSGSLFASERKALSAQTNRRHEAFFIGHGGADDRIPLGAATAARHDLATLGVPTSFHAYPGMGHTTGDAEVRDLIAWLAARPTGEPTAAAR